MSFTKILPAVISKAPEQKSIVTVENMTPEIYKLLLTTSRLKLVQQDDDDTYVPSVGSDLSKSSCMTSYNLWLTSYQSYFQSWANANCVPYRAVYRDECISILFQVNPQVPPCTNWWQYEDLQSIEIPAYFSS
ncbi:unnamed protein product [Adineta ricciae]|nr:unnamed protein product [Adineta ricciae]